jgi:hypothetical protein
VPGHAGVRREQAQALAIDLSRRSTPAEGGFCTFPPVIDGGACPWNLDCHNCDKFVLSGADLLYWPVMHVVMSVSFDRLWRVSLI